MLFVRLLACAARLAAAAGWGPCPDGAERVATNSQQRPWVCAWLEGPAPDSDCPKGSRAVSVPSSNRPFRCAMDGADPASPGGACPPGQRMVADGLGRTACTTVGAPPAFQSKSPLRCPQGFEPAPAKKGRRLRCVPAKAEEPDDAPEPAKETGGSPEPKPDAAGACPPGTRRVRTEDPFEPVTCAPEGEKGPPPFDPRRVERYGVPGELRFEYPQDWHVTDAWKEDVPSIYVELAAKRDGKPVMLTVSRYRSTTADFLDMDAAMRREADWHGAKAGGKGDVGGLPARFLEVPGATRSAYLRTADGYFLLSYSAPDDLFKRYLPAYARLLTSFRVVHDERDPMPEEEP